MKRFSTGLLLVVTALASMTANAATYDDGVECLAFIGVLRQAYGETPEMIASRAGWQTFLESTDGASAEAIKAASDAKSSEIMGNMAAKSSDREAITTYLTDLGQKCETPPPPPISPGKCFAVAESVRDSQSFLINANAYNASLQTGAEAEQSRKEMREAEARLAEAEKAVAHYQGSPKASLDELMSLLKGEPEEREVLLDRCLAQMGN